MTGSGCVPRLHHRRRSGGLDQCPVRPRRGNSSGTIPCRRVLIEQWSERHASHAAAAVTYTGETCGVRLACAQYFRPKGSWTALYPTFLCSRIAPPGCPPAGPSIATAATRPHQPKLAFTVCISKAYIPFPYLLLSITSVGKAHRLLSELSSEADTILINNDPLRAFGNSNWTRGTVLPRCIDDDRIPHALPTFSIVVRSRASPDASVQLALAQMHNSCRLGIRSKRARSKLARHRKSDSCPASGHFCGSPNRGKFSHPSAET